MRVNILKINCLLFIFSLFTSCALEIPEDVHEHEEIEKAVLTLTETETGNMQIINYIGNSSDKNIILENGKSYNAKIEFFVKHDGAFESILPELQEEKDEHFITYDFSGIDVQIIRNADDILRTDGNRLGISTLWTVKSAPDLAKAVITLHHAAESVNQNFPSAEDQKGKATGGETDAQALMNIR